MHSRSPPSFAQRLILYGLSIATPVLVLCGIFIYHYSVDHYRAIEAEALFAARELADDIDGEIDDVVLQLETLRGILGPELDLARLHRNVTDVLVPRGSHVVVHDISGWQLMNSKVPFGAPLNVTTNVDSIKRTLETHPFAVSGFSRDPETGNPVWVVSIPLRRDGHVPGIISISRPPEKLAELLNKLHRPANWRWGVADTQGIILARSQEAWRHIGESLPAEVQASATGDGGVSWGEGLDGVRVVRGFARSKATGWLATVAMPADVVEAPLKETWALFGIGSLVLLALAMLLGTAAARTLHGSVDSLVASAEKLGRGEPLTERFLATREFQHIHDALMGAADERRSSEERRQLLLRELQHRTNNLLAVISSMARRTLLEGRSMAEARDTLMGRLQALANASDTLAAAHWQGADIHLVIENEMRAFAGRYLAEGPRVLLSAQAAQNASLVIHELATNASKHGALSHPAGQVTINWSVEGRGSEADLRFSWIERGGPPAVPPKRRGFGYTLLETVLTDMGRKPDIQFAPEGLSYTTAVKLSTILANGAQLDAPDEQPSQSNVQPVRLRRSA